jgi:hypothetical protein
VWGCDTAEDEDTLNVKLTIHHVAGEEIWRCIEPNYTF